MFYDPSNQLQSFTTKSQSLRGPSISVSGNSDSSRIEVPSTDERPTTGATASSGSGTSATRAAPPPSFTVMSSSECSSRRSQKPLNPTAKEFSLPVRGQSNFTTPLFAMPEIGGMMMSQPQQQMFTHAYGMTDTGVFQSQNPLMGTAADFTYTWEMGLSRAGSPCGSSGKLPSPTSLPGSAGRTAAGFGVSPSPHTAGVTSTAMGWPQTPADTAAQTQQWLDRIRARYTAACKANGTHIVAVFNLEPRTTKEQLASMFFPMGASDAAIVDTFGAKRKTGVVFFPRKDFAMVGVEKMDNFVPNGQHQTLTVRYCGPDAEVSLLSGASEANAVGVANRSGNSSAATTPAVNGGGSSVSSATVPWAPVAGSAEAATVQEAIILALNVTPFSCAAATPVAIHGLDPTNVLGTLQQAAVMTGAMNLVTWPLPQSPVAAQWMYQSVSAVVWYASEGLAAAAVQTVQTHARTITDLTKPLTAALLFPPSLPSLQRGPQHSGNNMRLTSGTPLEANEGSCQYQTESAGPSQLTTFQQQQSNATECGAFFDFVDQHFLRKYADPTLHLVGVHNLASHTDTQTLYSIFYPMGAHDAALYEMPVLVAGKNRRSGVAIFSSRGMAVEAAAKINDFVPHGQSRPLIVRYLARQQPFSDPLAAKDQAQTRSSSSSLRMVSDAHTMATATPLHHHGSNSDEPRASTPLLDESSTPDELLATIDRLLRAPNLNKELLISSMTQLALHAEMQASDAERLAGCVADALIRAENHASMLATSLSDVLLQLHENLHIRRGGEAEDNGADDEDAVSVSATPFDQPLSTADKEKRTAVVMQLARRMMMLVTDDKAPGESRKVAAVLCAYFFQFPYLLETGGTPYSFAVACLRCFEKQLHEAKEYLVSDVRQPSSIDMERRNRPWIILVECLDKMISLWRTNYTSARLQSDPNVREYEDRVRTFYGTTPKRKGGAESPFPHGSGPSTAGGPSETVGSSGGSTATGMTTVATKRSALVTPSARPTPRRVVTRMSPSSGSGGNRKASQQHDGTGTGGASMGSAASVAGGACAPPQIVLRPNMGDAGTTTSRASATTHGSTGGLSSFSAQQQGHGYHHHHHGPAAAPEVVFSASGVPLVIQKSSSDNSECTVYITKLPSHFTNAQVRRLFLYFGEFNKVRLCRDEKNGIQHTLKQDRPLAGSASSSSTANYNKLSFGFVEFAESTCARAMIEYFRSSAHVSNSFAFMQGELDGAADGGSAYPSGTRTGLNEDDITLLCCTRASEARSPIHGQQPLDAVLRQATLSDSVELFESRVLIRVSPCKFGLVNPSDPVGQQQQQQQQGGAHAESAITNFTAVSAPPAPSPSAIIAALAAATNSNNSIAVPLYSDMCGPSGQSPMATLFGNMMGSNTNDAGSSNNDNNQSSGALLGAIGSGPRAFGTAPHHPLPDTTTVGSTTNDADDVDFPADTEEEYDALLRDAIRALQMKPTTPGNGEGEGSDSDDGDMWGLNLGAAVQLIMEKDGMDEEGGTSGSASKQ